MDIQLSEYTIYLISIFALLLLGIILVIAVALLKISNKFVALREELKKEINYDRENNEAIKAILEKSIALNTMLEATGSNVSNIRHNFANHAGELKTKTDFLSATESKILASIDNMAKVFSEHAGELKVKTEAIINSDANILSKVDNISRVFTGSSSRGQAGENVVGLVSSVFSQRIVRDFVIGNKVVEFAFKLRNGKYLAIDSKWIGGLELQDIEEADAAATADLKRKLQQKMEEVSQYIDPDRTTSFAVAAMPDALVERLYQLMPHYYRNNFQVKNNAKINNVQQRVLAVGYSKLIQYLIIIDEFAQYTEVDINQEGIKKSLQVMNILVANIDTAMQSLLRALSSSTAQATALNTHISSFKGQASNLEHYIAAVENSK